jgi:hypothetical protein
MFEQNSGTGKRRIRALEREIEDKKKTIKKIEMSEKVPEEEFVNFCKIVLCFFQ